MEHGNPSQELRVNYANSNKVSVTLFDCNHLAHVMVLWQMQKFMCYVYCTVFALFSFWIWGQFPSTSPRGLIPAIGGRFNGGFFALRDCWAYIWRGLFSEFYGIHLTLTDYFKERRWFLKVIRRKTFSVLEFMLCGSSRKRYLSCSWVCCLQVDICQPQTSIFRPRFSLYQFPTLWYFSIQPV